MVWISVKERMPELGDSVFIYSPSEGMYMASLKDQNEYRRQAARKHKDKWPVELEWNITDYCCYGSISLDQVSHWMPVPETPKQEQ